MTQVRLTPTQLVATIVFEAQINALQVAANQLGMALKMTAEADLLISARDVLIEGLERMRRKWSGQVILAQPSEVTSVQRVEAP